VTSTATLLHPASLRPRLHIRVQSFGRFDEILYLLEKASDLTLAASGRCHFLWQSRPAFFFHHGSGTHGDFGFITEL
jgi:hypothetical protein